MSRLFVVDLERVIELRAPNDRHAAQAADHIHSVVDQAIRDVGGDLVELADSHTQAYRGIAGACIYDSKDETL